MPCWKKTSPVEAFSEGSSSKLAIFDSRRSLQNLAFLPWKALPSLNCWNETARLTAEGLETEFCKVLEYRRAESRFLVTAGVGWDPEVVGKATVDADIESPAGYALITGKPVISNHLENEERFRNTRPSGATRHQESDERHPSGRRPTLWGSRGRQPARRRILGKLMFRSCRGRQIFWEWRLSGSASRQA